MPGTRRLQRPVRRLAALLAVLVALQLAVSAGMALADPQPQVVGGTLVPDGKYPFQVALLADGGGDEDGDGDIDDFDRQICGGTLLSSDWVLTAAHCVQGLSTAQLHVTVGRTVLSNPAQGQRRNVALVRVRVHPSYLTSSPA